MNNKENLRILMNLVYNLNEQTENHWFFTFSGNVNSVDIHYSKKAKCGECGHNTSYELVHFAYNTEYWELPELIKKIREYADKFIQSHEKPIP